MKQLSKRGLNFLRSMKKPDTHSSESKFHGIKDDYNK
jgi:hypothetical protein